MFVYRVVTIIIRLIIITKWSCVYVSFSMKVKRNCNFIHGTYSKSDMYGHLSMKKNYKTSYSNREYQRKRTIYFYEFVKHRNSKKILI